MVFWTHVFGQKVIGGEHVTGSFFTSSADRKQRRGREAWDKIKHPRTYPCDLPPTVRLHLLVFPESATIVPTIWGPSVQNRSLWGAFRIQNIATIFSMLRKLKRRLRI
jgi:hypothetical protein